MPMQRKNANKNRKLPYRIMVRGAVPEDIRRLISELHARALLQEKHGSDDEPNRADSKIPTKVPHDQNL